MKSTYNFVPGVGAYPDADLRNDDLYIHCS